MRILLAEDDANISMIAKMTLEQIGQHEVTVASDGAMALEFATTESFDLILLDEMMPKMNGIKVCEAYNSSGKTSGPVIFMSANAQEPSVSRFKEIALGFIPKPFDPKSLCQRIDEILTTKSDQAV